MSEFLVNLAQARLKMADSVLWQAAKFYKQLAYFPMMTVKASTQSSNKSSQMSQSFSYEAHWSTLLASDSLTSASNCLKSPITLYKDSVETVVAWFWVTWTKAVMTGIIFLWNLCLMAVLKILLSLWATSTKRSALLSKAAFPLANCPMMLQAAPMLFKASWCC